MGVFVAKRSAMDAPSMCCIIGKTPRGHVLQLFNQEESHRVAFFPLKNTIQTMKRNIKGIAHLVKWLNDCHLDPAYSLTNKQ